MPFRPLLALIVVLAAVPVVGRAQPLYSWGLNNAGQLGINSTSNKNAPFAIPTAYLASATTIGAGGSHSLATNHGTLNTHAWGLNASYQLAVPTYTPPYPQPPYPNRLTPSAVSAVSGVKFKKVVGGLSHSVALTPIEPGSTGQVYVWGSNADSQLGIGGPSSPAVYLLGLSGVVDIAAGDRHTLAVKSDGTVWVWGNDSFGQQGNGVTPQTIVHHIVPTQVLGLLNGVAITRVAAGRNSCFAWTATGTLYAWGNNSHGQLGIGTSGTQEHSPVHVTALPAVTEVAGGDLHTLFRVGGTVYTSGNDTFGQQGNNAPTANVLTPTAGTGITTAQQVACGKHTCYVVLTDGSMRNWGHNGFGQVGFGTTTTPYIVPKCVVIPGRSITEVAAGDYHAFVNTVEGSPPACLVYEDGCPPADRVVVDVCPPVRKHRLLPLFRRRN